MVLIEKLRSAITIPSGRVTNGWTKIPGIPSNICSDILSKQQSAAIYLLLVFCYYYPVQSCFAVVWYQKSNNPDLQKLWMCQEDFCKLSHLRNVQQELEDQGSPHLSSTGIQPTKTCAGLHPLICHPSIHPLVRLWQTQHHQHTRAAVRLTLFLRQSLSKCPRAPLCPGVQHQLNLSSRQSEEHWSHPISLHYETELVLCCHIAVVLQGRCCLIHHQGTKGLVGGGGGGGGAFLFLRHSYSLLLELHKHLGEVSQLNPD